MAKSVRPLANRVLRITEDQEIKELKKRVEDLEVLVNHLLIRNKTIEHRLLLLTEELQSKED